MKKLLIIKVLKAKTNSQKLAKCSSHRHKTTELQVPKILQWVVTKHLTMDNLLTLHVRKLTIMVRCMVAKEDLGVVILLDIQVLQASHLTRKMEGLGTLKMAVMASHRNLLAVPATIRGKTT